MSTSASHCPFCRYDLGGVDGSLCPECGATREAIVEARRRSGSVGGVQTAATTIYLLGMIPAWICLVALIIGWNTAMRLGARADIPFVQDGDYPVLDSLKVVVMISFALAVLCAPCLFGLPVALWCRWRKGRRLLPVLRLADVLLLASAPYIEAFVGLYRFVTPLGLDLFAWIPD